MNTGVSQKPLSTSVEYTWCMNSAASLLKGPYRLKISRPTTCRASSPAKYQSVGSSRLQISMPLGPVSISSIVFLHDVGVPPVSKDRNGKPIVIGATKHVQYPMSKDQMPLEKLAKLPREVSESRSWHLRSESSGSNEQEIVVQRTGTAGDCPPEAYLHKEMRCAISSTRIPPLCSILLVVPRCIRGIA